MFTVDLKTIIPFSPKSFPVQTFTYLLTHLFITRDLGFLHIFTWLPNAILCLDRKSCIQLITCITGNLLSTLLKVSTRCGFLYEEKAIVFAPWRYQRAPWLKGLPTSDFCKIIAIVFPNLKASSSQCDVWGLISLHFKEQRVSTWVKGSTISLP